MKQREGGKRKNNGMKAGKTQQTRAEIPDQEYGGMPKSNGIPLFP
jgi:hypothetical protein